MSVAEITSYAQFQDIIKSDKPVVIDFWAPWCGPCRFISPVFEKLGQASEFAGHVKLWKVNVDEQEEIATEVGVRAMPTFIAFKDGEKVDSVVGANPGDLEKLLKSVL